MLQRWSVRQVRTNLQLVWKIRTIQYITVRKKAQEEQTVQQPNDVQKYIDGNLMSEDFGPFDVLRKIIIASDLLQEGIDESSTINNNMEKLAEVKIQENGFSRIEGEQFFASTGIHARKQGKKDGIGDILKKDNSIIAPRVGKWYVPQPCSVKGSVDFLLGYDNKYISLSLKSSQKYGVVMWNSGSICPNFLYVCKFFEGTYYFFGRDYPDIPKPLEDKIREEFNRLAEKFNQNELKGTNKRIMGVAPAWQTPPFTKAPSSEEWLKIMKNGNEFIKARTRKTI